VQPTPFLEIILSFFNQITLPLSRGETFWKFPFFWKAAQPMPYSRSSFILFFITLPLIPFFLESGTATTPFWNFLSHHMPLSGVLPTTSRSSFFSRK